MPEKKRPVCQGCHATLGEQEPGELYRGVLIHRKNACRVKCERKFVLRAKFALEEIASSGRHILDEAVWLLKISEAVSLAHLENVAQAMFNQLQRSARVLVDDLIDRLDQWRRDFIGAEVSMSLRASDALPQSALLTAPAQA